MSTVSGLTYAGLRLREGRTCVKEVPHTQQSARTISATECRHTAPAPELHYCLQFFSASCWRARRADRPRLVAFTPSDLTWSGQGVRSCCHLWHPRDGAITESPPDQADQQLFLAGRSKMPARCVDLHQQRRRDPRLPGWESRRPLRAFRYSTTEPDTVKEGIYVRQCSSERRLFTVYRLRQRWRYSRSLPLISAMTGHGRHHSPAAEMHPALRD
jgi:hypothetical protein